LLNQSAEQEGQKSQQNSQEGEEQYMNFIGRACLQIGALSFPEIHGDDRLEVITNADYEQTQV